MSEPQIGLSLKLFVMHVNGLKLAIADPVVTGLYGGQITSKGQCLTYPGLRVNKIRYKQVMVAGIDPQTRESMPRKLKGLAQHEIDYLNGITIG